MSNHGHPKKFLLLVFDNFLTSFQQLSDGFLLHLANQDARTVTTGVVNCRIANMALDNSAAPSSRILNGQFKEKSAESC